MKFFVQYNVARGAFDLYVKSKTISGTPCVIDEYKESFPLDGEQIDPLFTLEEDEAQQLIDGLWAAGVRPKEIGTAGHLAATQYHLEDMRRLVFNGPSTP